MFRLVQICVTLSLLVWLWPSSPARAASGDLVLYDARIYTLDDGLPRAEAVIAQGGRITFVGSSAEALRRAPPDALRIALGGRTVVPGLTDSHAHLAGIGYRELEFNLQGTASLAELQDRLRDRAAQVPAGGWVVGRGWLESRWTPAVYPTRHDLDLVTTDRAVVLTRADGHALVANSLALERAGVDRNTKDPPGGSILRDAHGEPTGMLVDEAMELVRKLIPPRTPDDVLRALEVGAARSIRMGWTQLQDAGTSWEQLDLLCRLYAEGRVKLRVYAALDGPGPGAERMLEEGAGLEPCDERLFVRAIKLYVDGALGSRGAALLEPYADAPGTRGLLINEPQVLEPLLVRALERGVQIQTHAIGDRGNRIALDLYERAFASVPPSRRKVPDPRWRIEHAQVIDAADIPRFPKLGVIASMQPSHAIGDLFFAPDRLGPVRLGGAYAWRTLLEQGAIIAAGSDAPVEQGDPRIEFYAAVARRALDGSAGANWHLEQRVSRQAALEMLTRAPAYAAFQENERGSIAVGKQADFTVFSKDIMTIPEAEILDARVELTVIGGEVAYRASGS